MIQIKITDSIIYGVQTLIRESGYIARISLPWLPLVIIIAILDYYVFSWSKLLSYEIVSFICDDDRILSARFCRFLNIEATLGVVYDLIPVIIYVALFRHMIMTKRAADAVPTQQAKDLFPLRIGSFYFNIDLDKAKSFLLAVLAYFLLTVLVVIFISVIKQINSTYFFNIFIDQQKFDYESWSFQFYKFVNNYSHTILGNVFYTLLALVFADIAINGFSAFKKVIQRIAELRGNFLRLFIIMTILFLPHDIIDQGAKHIPSEVLVNQFFLGAYYFLQMAVFYICVFMSIIIVSRLYLKLST